MAPLSLELIDNVFSWEAPVSDGGSPILSYKIQMSSTVSGEMVYEAGPMENSIAVRTIVPCESPVIQIVAINAQGQTKFPARLWANSEDSHSCFWWRQVSIAGSFVINHFPLSKTNSLSGRSSIFLTHASPDLSILHFSLSSSNHWASTRRPIHRHSDSTLRKQHIRHWHFCTCDPSAIQSYATAERSTQQRLYDLVHFGLGSAHYHKR
ncbi:unnamed protein product [Protopolystoma xenopodis]|uniref:Fibronectin type-III domain-containing protein n=1 Tax=Protopolystoma xenopodis TaxID=117903 RepID=A0A3S5CQP5_9PLAT|nr:unnamed protein product [Protopolystoma xenopodis]